ncbi:MAG: sodium:calcium antiporter, partial [Lachnospiraceae bacterium]|nr:sodium:calcium antiporter [Lachnospiraceae bacterium]
KRIFSGDFFGHGMEEVAGRMDRLPAIILLIAFVIYILMLIMIAKKQPQQPEKEEESMATGKCILFILIGLAFIVGGGQAVVYSAKEIARSFGMTETLIGLTVIALGTSLPELVTSAVAAKKGQTELAVGNVLGSNSFNLMFILGISATIRPMDVNFASVYDLVILLGITLLTYLFSFTSKKIVRWEGIVMLLLYAADMTFAIMR